MDTSILIYGMHAVSSILLKYRTRNTSTQ